MSKHSIIYLGDHKNLPLDIEYLKETLKCNFKVLCFDENFNNLFSNIIKVAPEIILLEISKVNGKLLSFLILLKSHSRLKNSRIIALFPDKSNLEKYSDIYSFGVEYGFIAGEEGSKIIGDIGIFLDSKKYQPIQYAQARNLYIPANSKFLAKVSHLSEHTLSIETSLSLKKGDRIEANFSFGDILNLNFFKVEESNHFLPRSYFSNSATLKILYKGDSDLGSKIIGPLSTKNDVQFFLLQIKDETFPRNDPALIIDRRTDTLVNLLDELNVNNRYIKITDSYSAFEEKLSILSPHIICYQMEQENDDMMEDDLLKINGPTTFDLLIKKVKSVPGYNPYILVFNERSRSQAYRKAHSYEKIIVNKRPFELSYLSMIIAEFQKNHIVQHESTYLRPPDPKTIIEINKEIILTSISENQLSFLYDGNLTPYSTFKISAPLNIFVTIIPSSEDNEGKKKMRSYKGIIANTSEEEKMELRKLVNLLIKIEIPKGENFVLKSVQELKEDVINSKAAELKEVRLRQKKEQSLKIE